jgi:hypothetical protein
MIRREVERITHEIEECFVHSEIDLIVQIAERRTRQDGGDD